MEGSKRYQVRMRPIGHGVGDAELIGETDDMEEAERSVSMSVAAWNRRAGREADDESDK